MAISSLTMTLRPPATISMDGTARPVLQAISLRRTWRESDVSSGYEYCNKNCPSETYLKLDYNDPKNVNTVTATTCGSCHSGVDGCKRCVGAGSDECLVCNVGYYLDRGSIDTQLHGTCVAKSGSASGEWFLTATAYTGYKDGSSTYPFDQLAEALEAISSAAAPYESYTAVLQVEGGNHWELPYMKTRTLF